MSMTFKCTPENSLIRQFKQLLVSTNVYQLFKAMFFFELGFKIKVFLISFEKFEKCLLGKNPKKGFSIKFLRKSLFLINSFRLMQNKNYPLKRFKKTYILLLSLNTIRKCLFSWKTFQSDNRSWNRQQNAHSNVQLCNKLLEGTQIR